MRVLHLDAGRECAPLFIGARKRSWCAEPLGLLRTARGSRTHMLAAPTRNSTFVIAPHEQLRAA